MKDGYLICHNKCYSFTLVAHLLGEYLRKKNLPVSYSCGYEAGHTSRSSYEWVIHIEDSVRLCLTPWRYQRGVNGTTAWTDTCLNARAYKGLKKYKSGSHVVCSHFNLENLRAYGVVDVVPRTFNKPAAEKFRNRDSEGDYYVAIGCKDPLDRKNLRALADLVKKTSIHVKAITNAEGPWERIPYGSISEEEKYRILAGARFLIHLAKAEGFGLPPLEAMSVGTPVIFSDAPAHRDFSVGLRIRTKNARSVSCRGRLGYKATFWEVSLNDAVKVVQESKTLSKEEYSKLREECIEHARLFHPEVALEHLYCRYLR